MRSSAGCVVCRANVSFGASHSVLYEYTASLIVGAQKLLERGTVADAHFAGRTPEYAQLFAPRLRGRSTRTQLFLPGGCGTSASPRRRGPYQKSAPEHVPQIPWEYGRRLRSARHVVQNPTIDLGT
jgi:hypothetical protein